MKPVYLILIAFTVIMVSCTSAPQEEPEAKKITVVYDNKSAHYIHFEYLSQALGTKFPEYEFRYIDPVMYYYYDDQSAQQTLKFDYPGFDEIGVFPDLIIDIVNVGTSRLFAQDYTYDLESAMRTTNIDLASFEPAYLDHIRAMSPDGSLRALPLTVNLHALGYNPEVITEDQLTVVHTWEDLADISLRVSMGGDIWPSMFNQYGLRYWNKQDQVELDRDVWEPMLRMYQQIKYGTEGSTAIMPISTMNTPLEHAVGMELYPLPRISEADNVGANRLYQLAAVGPSSKNVDDVMKVLEYITSSEYQLGQARQGFGSVLDRDEVREQFGADHEYYKGKNVAAFFTLRPSEVKAALSKYERIEWRHYPEPSLYVPQHTSPIIRKLLSGELDPKETVEALQNQLDAYETFVLGLPLTSY